MAANPGEHSHPPVRVGGEGEGRSSPPTMVKLVFLSTLESYEMMFQEWKIRHYGKRWYAIIVSVDAYVEVISDSTVVVSSRRF